MNPIQNTQKPFYLERRDGISQFYQSDPFIVDREGNNPFQYACKQGDLERVEAYYQSMTVSDESKAKASLSRGLVLACQEGHLAIAQLLVVKFLANVNHDQCSALKAALENKKDNIACYLIQNPQINIDVREKTKFYKMIASEVKGFNIFLKLACKSGADDSVLREIFNKITLTQEDLYCICVFKKTRLIAFDQQKIHWDDVNRKIDNEFFWDDLKSLDVKCHGSCEMLLHIAGAQNDVKLAMHLLKNKQATVNIQNTLNETPLFVASANGSLELAQILIETKANINAQNGQKEASLSYATANNHRSIVEFLVSKGANIELGQPLERALQNNAFSCAFYLILKKASTPRIFNNKTVNFLRYICKEEKNASDEGKQLVVEVILTSSPVDFVTQENCLLELLCVIAKDGNYLVLSALLSYINQRSSAILKEQLNKTDQDGNTPLHYACEGKSNLSVLLLINHGAEINKPNRLGKTAIDLMVQWKLRPVLQCLWDEKRLDAYKINNLECMLSLLCQDAKERGDLVSSMRLKAGKDLSSAPYKDQRTYLHIACQYGNHAVAQVLLDINVDLTSQDSFGQLPLHLALENDLVPIAGEMIRRLNGHPCLNCADRQGRTPLHVACRKNARLAIQLIGSGVNVNQLDATGRTPLHEAFNAQMEDVALALINHGATLDIADLQGNKPIVLALENCFGKIAYLLAKKSNDYKLGQIKTSAGDSLFRLACERENWPLAFLLFAKGGVLDDLKPVSLRHEFCYHAHRKNRKKDQANRVNIDTNEIKNIQLQSTVLHKALLKSDRTLAASLIKEGKCLDQRDHRNRCPIHIACERGLVEEFESLLRAMLQNSSGQELPEALADELVISAAKGNAKNVLYYHFPPMTVVEKHRRFYSLLKKNFNEAKPFLELNGCNLSDILFSSFNGKATEHLLTHCEHGNIAYLQMKMLEVCSIDKHLSAILAKLVGKDPECLLNAMYSRNRSKDLSYFTNHSIVSKIRSNSDVFCKAITSGHFLMAPLAFALGALDKTAVHSALMPSWRSPHILNQLEMFEDWGVNLMQPDKNQNGPLHWACRYPHNIAVVNHLLSKGLDVNKPNLEHNTPLHIACCKGATGELVIALLNAGADLKLKNINGDTPLHLACKSEDYNLTKLILQTCIKRNDWDSLKIRNSSGIWPDFEFMCKEPHAQKIQTKKGEFLSHALVLIGRSSHFRQGFELSRGEINMPSIQVAEEMPVEFFDEILSFFHTGKLKIDKKKWLRFFQEVEFFNDQDLDLACRDWLHSNYKELGNIEEAIDFFADLGEAWENEVHFLLSNH